MKKETIKELQEEINNFGMKYGTHPDSIDEKLYKEDVEIIQLNYDRASKMLTVWSSTFLGSAALSVALYEKIRILFRFFLITGIISIFRTRYRNVRMNKCFNTAIKKIKENNNKQQRGKN